MARTPRFQGGGEWPRRGGREIEQDRNRSCHQSGRRTDAIALVHIVICSSPLSCWSLLAIALQKSAFILSNLFQDLLTPPPLPSPVPTPPPLPPRETPSAVTLFRLYCVVMVLLLSLGAGYAYLLLSGTIAPSLGILESIAAAEDPVLREELIAKEMGRARTFVGLAAVGVPASILGAKAMGSRLRWVDADLLQSALPDPAGNDSDVYLLAET